MAQNSHQKKKILFVVPQLTYGGSNRSLATLLSFMSKYPDLSFNVVVLSAYGPSDSYFKSFQDLLLPLSWIYRTVVSFMPLRKLLNALKNFLHIDLWNVIYKHEACILQNLYHFDMVVGFEESYATKFASNFICRKIAWLHCDYNSYWAESNHLDESRMYSLFDSIVCVSDFARNVFLKYYPEVGDRVIRVYNLLDVDEIKCKSREVIDDDKFNMGEFIIVSVGRVVPLKQFHLIPSWVKKILDLKPELKFHWYIIGDGDAKLIHYIQRQIETCDLGGYITLLGQKQNTYPYIKEANLLLCTSKTESWSYVIHEANVLCTPVVTLHCGSSDEVMLKNAGCITDADSLPSLLVSLIGDSKGCYTSLKDNLDNFSYDNQTIENRLYDLFTSI